MGGGRDVARGDGVLICRTDERAFETLKAELAAFGFVDWTRLENSAGFVLASRGKAVFEGDAERPICYSVAKAHGRDGQSVVVLFDVKEARLYCALTSDVGG